MWLERGEGEPRQEVEEVQSQRRRRHRYPRADGALYVHQMHQDVPLAALSDAPRQVRVRQGAQVRLQPVSEEVQAQVRPERSREGEARPRQRRQGQGECQGRAHSGDPDFRRECLGGEFPLARF